MAEGTGEATTTFPFEKKYRGKKKRRSRLRKIVSRYAGYYVLCVVHAMACRLPLPVGRALAKVFGAAAYYLAGRERRLAFYNLRRAYGDEMTEAEIRSTVRGVFRNLALSVIEWVILRRWPPEKLVRAFPEVPPVLEQLRSDVLAAGSGAIGLTAHLGNWEVLALMYNATHPGFLVPVANRIYFSKYQDFFHHMRAGAGLEVIYSDESPRKVLRAVREKKLPSFLADLDLRTNSGVFVEFFGIPAYTVTFPMDIARKLDVPFVVAILKREGKKFRLSYSGLEHVPVTGDPQADAKEATQRWSRIVEDVIREDPSQWAWIQPRWRTQVGHPRTRTHQWPAKTKS